MRGRQNSRGTRIVHVAAICGGDLADAPQNHRAQTHRVNFPKADRELALP